MDLQELNVYNSANSLAQKVWDIVIKWNIFERSTIGKQWITAADSVGANISESYGRYYFKDARLFLYFARGSLSESTTWLSKAYQRNLISEKEYQLLVNESKDLWIRLNNYIRTVGKNTQ